MRLFLVSFRFIERSERGLWPGTALLLLGQALKPWGVLLLGIFPLAQRWRAFFSGVVGYVAVFVIAPALR